MRVLRAAGISTRADLEKLGPVKAFMAAKRVEPSVTLNLLWGIAGALTDTHWSKLSAQYRSELLLEYDGQLDAERSLAVDGQTAAKAKRGRTRRSAPPSARRRETVGT
jgi:hypothetical protein